MQPEQPQPRPAAASGAIPRDEIRSDAAIGPLKIDQPDPSVRSGTLPPPRSMPPRAAPSTPPSPGARRYAWVLLTGVLGYLAISAVLLSAYVLTEGRGFFIPMRWPTLSFIQLFGGPTFLAAFVPFVGVHMIATAMRMHVTPRSAAAAGAAMGALAGWSICGRQGCFGPFGTFPLLGWYITACCLFSALFYQLNARKHGF